MLKHALIVLTLAGLPLTALADDTAPAQAASSAPASAGLGPDAVSPPAGGSNGDSTALQPAGLSPIQSGTSDAAGLGAPSSALQAPAAASDQLKVLSGEADGASHQLDEVDSPSWIWPAALALALLVAAAAVIWRDRRRFHRVEI